MVWAIAITPISFYVDGVRCLWLQYFANLFGSQDITAHVSLEKKNSQKVIKNRCNNVLMMIIIMMLDWKKKLFDKPIRYREVACLNKDCFTLGLY